MKKVIIAIVGVALSFSAVLAEQPVATFYGPNNASLLHYPNGVSQEGRIAKFDALIKAGSLTAPSYLAGEIYDDPERGGFESYLKLRRMRGDLQPGYERSLVEIYELLELREPKGILDIREPLREQVKAGNEKVMRYVCLNVATLREKLFFDACHVLVEKGDLDAQFILAAASMHHLVDRMGFWANPAKPDRWEWYKRLGVPLDAGKGVAALKGLAVQGHIKSHARLAYAFLEGEGTRRDDGQAYLHAATAAAAGNKEGKRWLGLLHFSDRGVPENGPTNEQVLNHLIDVASDGDAISQLMLAHVYANGLAWYPTEGQRYTSRIVDAMVWGEVYRRRTDKEHIRLQTFDVDYLKDTLQELRFFETRENLVAMYTKMTAMAPGGALTATAINLQDIE